MLQRDYLAGLCEYLGSDLHCDSSIINYFIPCKRWIDILRKKKQEGKPTADQIKLVSYLDEERTVDVEFLTFKSASAEIDRLKEAFP